MSDASGSGEQMSDKAKEGLVSLGVGLAAAGVGAAVGVAADRAIEERAGRRPDTENYGGLHIPGQTVIADDGAKLHVEIDEIDGEPDLARPTLVFSHGYALSMDTWHFQRKFLRGRYRMVFWDQRGHGRSGVGARGHSTIDQIGHDLAAVIAAVAPSGPLVLVGHSMGGMTVMSLAAHYPQLIADRVIAVGFVATSAGGLDTNDLGLWRLGNVVQRMGPGTLRLLTRAPWLVKHARRLISEVETQLVGRYSYASPVSPALLRFTAAVIAATPLEVVADFLPTFAVHDKRSALGAFEDMPSLVIVGDSDLLTPPEHSAQIAARLPESEHVVVPDGGHLIMLEHPDRVNDRLVALFDRMAHGAPPPRRRSKSLLRGISSAWGRARG